LNIFPQACKAQFTIQRKARQPIMKFRIFVSSAALLLNMGVVSPGHAKDCEKDATNMAEVRTCVADNIDKDLTETLNATTQFVRTKSPQSAELLLIAQISWKKFADDSCAYSVTARQTEMMANDARLACWSAFVRARIKVLNAYRRDFGKTDF
jgi:uncharacterized protein YecT (DUF1311 family)